MVASFGISDGVDAVSRRVLTGHQTRSAGSTIRSTGVSIGEDEAFGSKAVDVGRFVIIAAHESDVGPTHVVDEKEDDVRLSGVSVVPV